MIQVIQVIQVIKVIQLIQVMQVWTSASVTRLSSYFSQYSWGSWKLVSVCVSFFWFGWQTGDDNLIFFNHNVPTNRIGKGVDSGTRRIWESHPGVQGAQQHRHPCLQCWLDDVDEVFMNCLTSRSLPSTQARFMLLPRRDRASFTIVTITTLEVIITSGLWFMSQ